MEDTDRASLSAPAAFVLMFSLRDLLAVLANAGPQSFVVCVADLELRILMENANRAPQTLNSQYLVICNCHPQTFFSLLHLTFTNAHDVCAKTNRQLSELNTSVPCAWWKGSCPRQAEICNHDRFDSCSHTSASFSHSDVYYLIVPSGLSFVFLTQAGVISISLASG